MTGGQADGGDADGAIDIRRLLHTLWRRKMILMISVVFCAILGLLAASQIEPRYSASAWVLINPDRLNVVNMEQVLVSPEANQTNIQNHVEIIRSSALLEDVIAELDLAQTAEFNPPLRPEETTLFEQARDFLLAHLPDQAFLDDLGILPPSRTEFRTLEEQVEYDERRRIIGTLRQDMNVRALPNSRVIEIRFTSTSPRLGARVANAVANQFIAEQVNAQLEATRSATAWLSEQSEELQVRVREAERAVEMMRAELTQAAGQGSQVTAQQLQVFVGALANARAKRSSLEIRLDLVNQAMDANRDMGVVPEFRASSIMEEYRQRMSDLRDQEVALRAVRSADLVELRIVEARMADVATSIHLEAQRIAQGLATELIAAQTEEQALLDQISALEQKALEQAREELRLRELEREAEASRRLYENIFARLNEISVQETLQTPGARLLTAAEPAERPDTASARRTVMVASVAGVFVGFGLIMLIERLNNTFRSIEEIERETSYPVLATLPRVGARKKLPKIVQHLREDPNSDFAEAVRNLRTSILFSDIDAPPKVVMLTSSVPMEGKSTTSLLLAIASQQAGKSTIVVDCDLRRPALGDIFPAEEADKPGLLKLLEGECKLDDALVKDPHTGLHLLAMQSDRQVRVSAADILTSKKFAALVAGLRDRYDLVILDTPPVLIATDARVVASVADVLIYAVRSDHTSRNAVMEGLRELDRINAPVRGTVLTMVNETTSKRYAKEGYGYYRRQYRGHYSS